MSGVRVDRSMDGEHAPAFLMQYQGLLAASDDGEPMAVLHFSSDKGETPIGLCKTCTTRLLEALLELKRLAPEHFDA